MSESPHPIIQARRAQMFPTLVSADIDRLRRFGETRSYGSGECIIRAGDVAPGLIVVLSKLVMVRARISFA
jgi:thioredoxin reductase (NADPH)